MVAKPALIDALSELLRRDAAAQFEFFPFSHGEICVNTPLLYPDGEEVQVWVLERDGDRIVTDHGEGSGWLLRARCFHDLTEGQLALLDEVRRSLFLEGEGVELVARCTDDDQVIWALHRVALAAVRVADISYTCHPGGGLVGQPRTKLNKPDQT